MDLEIAIAWTNLTFTTKNKCFSKETTVLDSLKGAVAFGTLTALMGPSDSGNTTLLKCLSHQIKYGISSETLIYANNNSDIRSCFIHQRQRESLSMCLTVKQNLIYASKLKNSCFSYQINHQKCAEDLMSELSMSHIADIRVVNCSDNQQQCLSIAIELTQYDKPNFMCIDKPTTGLDIKAAENVIQCLSNISKAYKIAVIVSIDVPNTDTLMLIDQLYVLAKTGLCVYFGSPRDLSVHLTECEIEYNPNERPIEALVRSSANNSDDQYIQNLSDKTNDDMEWLDNKCQTDTKFFDKGVFIQSSKRFNLFDIWYLLMRMITTDYICKWKSLLAEMIISLTFPIILGLLFNRDITATDGCLNDSYFNRSCTQILDEQLVLDDGVKYHYLVAAVMIVMRLTLSTVVFQRDVQIFFTEHQNRWYSTGVFYLTKNLIDIVPVLFCTVIMSITSFYMTAPIYDTHRLVQYVTAFIFGAIETQSLAYLLVTLFVNLKVLSIIGMSIILFVYSNVFSNAMLRIDDLPLGLQSIGLLSMVYHLYNQILVIIYGLNWCPNNNNSYVMQKFGLTNSMVNSLPIYQLSSCLIFRILALLILYIKANNTFDCMKNLMSTHIKFKAKSSESENRKNSRNLRRVSVIDVNKIFGKVYVNEEKIEFENRLEIIERQFDSKSHREISIAWTDLTFKKIDNCFANEVVILDSINGYLELGTLTALTGPLDSGKTTLLNIINGLHKSYLTNETQIHLNRYQLIRKCFIAKDVSKHMLCGLKAREALIYASMLKNVNKDIDHKTKVNEMMNDLLISDIADTSCGNCSVGQQKRLIVAMELIACDVPNVICIDDPIDGLDIMSAEVVIQCLKYLSRKYSISIVTSIVNSIGFNIFNQFDRLYILSNCGKCLYYGLPTNLKSHLNDCSIIVDEFQTPVEVINKLALNDNNDNLVIKLTNTTSVKLRDDILMRYKNEIKISANGFNNGSKRFNWSNFWTVMRRTVIYNYRYYWKVLLLELIVVAHFAIVLRLYAKPEMTEPNGCVGSFDDEFPYRCNKSDAKLDDESLTARNIAYHWSMISGFVLITLVISTLKCLIEMKTFLTEHRNVWYSTGVYFWTKTVANIIPTLINTLIVTSIANIYNQLSIFLMLTSVMTLASLVIQSMGYLIGVLFSGNKSLAAMIVAACFADQLLLSNFIVLTKNLHYFLEMVSDLSVIKLVSESIVVFLYGFNRCNDNELSFPLYYMDITDQIFFKNIRLLVYQMLFYQLLTLIAIIIKTNAFPEDQSYKQQFLLLYTRFKPKKILIL
ncbi:uncharacterized protein LOC128961156 [Oppia nitens]|uniref:uncharacterized protein LOC128961156 n=1 Tax=Oppia nitens TaxID=1686743 RepID=UPI0023D9FB0E|nr:uncharacterized protein LOC128961156 [Oppia nitens]